RILGEVDGAHAALTQLLEDAVAAEDLRQLLLRRHGKHPSMQEVDNNQPNRGLTAVKDFSGHVAPRNPPWAQLSPVARLTTGRYAKALRGSGGGVPLGVDCPVVQSALDLRR